MFCIKCGTKNPDDAVFCSGCGVRLESQSVADKPKSVGLMGSQCKSERSIVHPRGRMEIQHSESDGKKDKRNIVVGISIGLMFLFLVVVYIQWLLS
ncbi:MAG TPA: zinc ribbon domain-containing protein [Candidatus Coprenecus pullistercoris]|nr:zinc ribbon domain-containing protein [Candidatus Coprenecus pullistercoris]